MNQCLKYRGGGGPIYVKKELDLDKFMWKLDFDYNSIVNWYIFCDFNNPKIQEYTAEQNEMVSLVFQTSIFMYVSNYAPRQASNYLTLM